MAISLCGMVLKYSAKYMVRKAIQPTNASYFVTLLSEKLQVVFVLGVLPQVCMLLLIQVVMLQPNSYWT